MFSVSDSLNLSPTNRLSSICRAVISLLPNSSLKCSLTFDKASVESLKFSYCETTRAAAPVVQNLSSLKRMSSVTPRRSEFFSN